MTCCMLVVHPLLILSCFFVKQFIVIWKEFSLKCAKFYSHVHCNLVVEWRIIQMMLSFLFNCIAVFFCEHKIIIMFSLLHFFGVQRGGFFKIFFG